jgi:hypothetical protein
MQINLEASEVAAVLNVLNSYIPQLREEIGKTDNYEMRQGLKAQAEMLSDIVTKLGGTVPGGEGSNLGAKNPPWG